MAILIIRNESGYFDYYLISQIYFGIYRTLPIFNQIEVSKMIIHKKTTTTENSYTFEIMGDEYVVKGTDNPEYMEEIIQHIDSVISSIINSNQKLMKSQVAVLAALKIADELYKLRQEYERLEQRKSKLEK